MSGVVVLVVIIAAWLILSIVVLPRLGHPT
jgi:hypothetical protein